MTPRGHPATPAPVLLPRHAPPRRPPPRPPPARPHPGGPAYEGPGHPYAVEAAGEPGATVAGEIVTARPETYDALLAELDRLEEYVPGGPRTPYDRVARTLVRDADGTSVRAWVYVAAPAAAARLRVRVRRVGGGSRPAGCPLPPPAPAG